MNARVEQRLAVERALLRPLPARRTAEFDEIAARVSKYGIFTVKGAQYSAPSRLIGHRLTVGEFAEHVEVLARRSARVRVPAGDPSQRQTARAPKRAGSATFRTRT